MGCKWHTLLPESNLNRKWKGPNRYYGELGSKAIAPKPMDCARSLSSSVLLAHRCPCVVLCPSLPTIVFLEHAPNRTPRANGATNSARCTH
jgi:hypothetical protein